jgi:tetratricopeptide (TPR) repeat protein
MTTTQIHTIYLTILDQLIAGQIKKAIENINSMVSELLMGEYADRLNDIEQNYKYLLHYYISGVQDPERKLVYNKLIAKAFVLNSDLKEELLLRNSSDYVYSQKRYFPHTKKYTSVNELYISLKYYHSQSALIANLESTHDVERKRLRSNYEFSVSELFKSFWLQTYYSHEDKDVLNKVMNVQYVGWIEKTLLVSALTLNLCRMFDESKLLLLFDCCKTSDQRVKQRALVGLCFVLAKYNQFLTYFPSVRNRLVLLADDSHTAENFQNIILQIIATTETDKISKKMQEEILPEMIKISPLLKDKMNLDNQIKSDEWDELNPDWQDLIQNSGVTDKLQEINDLQMQGADVYMSTFSMLKSFAFFSEISNWFIPFDGQNSNVKELFSTDDKTLISAFMNNSAMCNSDKYSFCLSVLQMPESQRSMLKHSFSMEAEQLSEISKDESILTPDLVSKNLSKQYVQDLFRFFKLYPQHNDFANVFDFSLSMHRTNLFEILSSEGDFKQSIAEYYFLKNQYAEALEIFRDIQIDNPTASLYQKIGFSYQQLSNLPLALDAYLKADIIHPDDSWTIRKIALCYRLSGNFAKALEYYQHIDFLKPNQPTILLQIGHCFLELKKYNEALSVYFKLDAQNGDNVKVWRAITWCAFVSGNLEQSDYYLQKLIENNPSAHDYLNAAHVAWCKRNLNKALEYYRKSLLLLDNDWDLFMKSFNADKNYLFANGVEADEVPLLLDLIL